MFPCRSVTTTTKAKPSSFLLPRKQPVLLRLIPATPIDPDVCVSGAFAASASPAPGLEQAAAGPQLLQPAVATGQAEQPLGPPGSCNSSYNDFSEGGGGGILPAGSSSPRNSIQSEAESILTKQSSASQRGVPHTPATSRANTASSSRKENSKPQVRRLSEPYPKSGSGLQHKASIRLMKKKQIQKTLSTEEGSSGTSHSPAKTRKQSSIKRVFNKITGAHRKSSIPSEDSAKPQSDFLEQFDSIPDNRIVENWLLSIDDDDTSQVESEPIQDQSKGEEEDYDTGNTTPTNMDVTEFMKQDKATGPVQLEMDVGVQKVDEGKGGEERQRNTTLTNMDVTEIMEQDKAADQSVQLEMNIGVQEGDKGENSEDLHEQAGEGTSQETFEHGDLTPVNMKHADYVTVDKDTGMEVKLDIDLGNLTMSEPPCSGHREKKFSFESSSDDQNKAMTTTTVENLKQSWFTRQVSSDSRRSVKSGENSEITAFNTRHNSNPHFTCEGDSIRSNPASFFKPIMHGYISFF